MRGMNELERSETNRASVEEMSESLSHSVAGIILSGGLNVSLLVVAVAIFEWVDLRVIPLLVAISFGVGAIAAAFSCLVVGPALMAITWSFGMVFGPRAAVSIFGGWCGLLPCIPPFSAMASESTHMGENIFEFSLICLLPISVTFVAMLFGHLGAIISASPYGKIPTSMRIQRIETREKWSYQFKISNLMIATVWIALLVGLTKTFGILFPLWLILGCTMQAILLGIDRIWLFFCDRSLSEEV